MNLNDALTLLAMQLQLDPAELIRYAAEDTLGGYDADPARAKWPMGSLYAVEGQTLYALIRTLKPQHVAEIGSLRGCSTAHIATALSVNGSGRVTAIDIAAGSRDLFPAHLESVLTPVTGDGLAWLAAQPDASIDLLYEDSSHGTEMCAAVGELCKTKLTPGGLLVVHDAAHDFAILGGGHKITSPVGAEIRLGLDRALGTTYRVYLAEPSDCGVAVWRRSPVKTAVWEGIPIREGWAEKPKHEMITEDGEHLEIVDAPPTSGLESVYEADATPYNTPTQPKVKRTRKSKGAK